MKQSFYNIIIKNTKQNETIIYNTLYGSLASFNEQEFSNVEKILKNPAIKGKDLNSIRSVLIKQKYLINSNKDESAIIKNRKKSGISDKNRLDLIIIPTLNCNFDCKYCYEDKKAGFINNNTKDALKFWLQSEIPKYKLVWISWFGGEPLLNYNIIKEITSLINKIASKNKIKIINHITTNGYLLTKEKIAELSALKIFNYQITIDGNAETHNNLRPLKNGEPTFDRVFNNIILLVQKSPKIKVSLRINFNHTNINLIPELLKMFPKEYTKQLRLALEPIFGSKEFNAAENLNSTEITSKMAEYYGLAKTLGYDVNIAKSTVESGKLVFCYAERKNQYIINFNGDVFKCSVINFETSNRIGYISKSGKFIKELNNWKQWMDLPLFDRICMKCRYIPICMGGCRKYRIENKGTGNVCSLIPENTTYILKKISYGELSELIINEI